MYAATTVLDQHGNPNCISQGSLITAVIRGYAREQ
jgi:hypothetical protein